MELIIFIYVVGFAFTVTLDQNLNALMGRKLSIQTRIMVSLMYIVWPMPLGIIAAQQIMYMLRLLYLVEHILKVAMVENDSNKS